MIETGTDLVVGRVLLKQLMEFSQRNKSILVRIAHLEDKLQFFEVVHDSGYSYSHSQNRNTSLT